MRLVYNKNDFVAQWVSHHLKVPSAQFFSPYVAIGIEDDGIMRGGVIYNNFRLDPWGKPHSVEISGASIDKRCALRHIIRPLLLYPFEQLNVLRVQMTIAKPNMVARHFAERLGFILEGCLKKGHFSGKDATIYGLTKADCKWINESRQPVTAISAQSARNIGGTDTKQSGNCAL